MRVCGDQRVRQRPVTVNDLTKAGYVVERKDGRRNRYRIQNHLPLPAPIGREPTIGELLGVLVDTSATGSGGPA